MERCGTPICQKTVGFTIFWPVRVHNLEKYKLTPFVSVHVLYYKTAKLSSTFIQNNKNPPEMFPGERIMLYLLQFLKFVMHPKL